MTALRIETVDSPTWHAAVIVRGAGDIQCIGFKTRRRRDAWLGHFLLTLRAIADTVTG